MKDLWNGSATCETALDMIDDIARQRAAAGGYNPTGMESMTLEGLEGAYMRAIGNWLDGIKTWMYEAKKSIANAVAAAIASAGAFKAFRHTAQAGEYFKEASDILKSPEGKTALAQMADPKHKSLYNRVARFFTGGKDLTHLVVRAENFTAAGKHNLKLAALAALVSIMIAIGAKLSIGKIKSTSYAIDNILKLPLPSSKEQYDQYIQKVTTLVADHSYITIDGYVASALATEVPDEAHIENKISAINALSASMRGIPDRIAILTKSDAAKTQYGRKGLHFTVTYLERIMRETESLTACAKKETEHLAGREDY